MPTIIDPLQPLDDGAAALSDAPAQAWLDRGLAEAGLADERPLAQRISAFQFTQGLPPDGRLGPLTAMRLNPLSGLDEPRLAGA